MIDTNPRHMMVINGAHDDSFSEWYRNTHIREVLAVNGFIRARQHELAGFQPASGPPGLHRFLTTLELEGDPQAVFAALQVAREDGRISPPPSKGRGTTSIALFSSIVDLAYPSQA